MSLKTSYPTLAAALALAIGMAQAGEPPRTYNANAIFEALTVEAGAVDARRINLDIQFELNSDRLSPKARKQLEELGRALKRIPQDTLEIAGHTDSLGDTAYNLELSRKRAQRVKDYLVEHFGLNPKKLVATGYGERFPRSGRAASDPLNRRVEIINHGRWVSPQEVEEGSSSFRVEFPLKPVPRYPQDQ